MKFSIYLNRRVLVMICKDAKTDYTAYNVPFSVLKM